MCFKRKDKNEPVRLQKKEELSWFKLNTTPELLLITGVAIVFILIVIFALWESIPYFVYNRGL